MSVNELPQAERGVWHRVLGDFARSMVTGEPMATWCGGKVLPVLVTGVGSGARVKLETCRRCDIVLDAYGSQWGDVAVDQQRRSSPFEAAQ